ncbi:unnamed protein product [Pleuronectes platessa]|uniref:Uncharacterized protein n=1 Tax=Pleuronectes platessa TaxID=8262 RepID=A0A9N7VJN2_PLEPL|nr:unnamed protein product [Pleuronectes platessa]
MTAQWGPDCSFRHSPLTRVHNNTRILEAVRTTGECQEIIRSSVHPAGCQCTDEIEMRLTTQQLIMKAYDFLEQRLHPERGGDRDLTVDALTRPLLPNQLPEKESQSMPLSTVSSGRLAKLASGSS